MYGMKNAGMSGLIAAVLTAVLQFILAGIKPPTM